MEGRADNFSPVAKAVRWSFFFPLPHPAPTPTTSKQSLGVRTLPWLRRRKRLHMSWRGLGCHWRGAQVPKALASGPATLTDSEAAQKVGGWVSGRSARNRLQPPGSSTACKAVSVLCYHLWWLQVSGPLFRGSHFSGRSLSPSARHMCGQPTQQHTGRCLEVPSLARPKR